MVSGFRRSASMPKPTRPAQEKSYHTRSTSLPARSHPLLSQLKDQVETLWSWVSDRAGPSSTRICDGLNRLRSIHDAVDDLLQLVQSQDALRRQPELVDELLERFLRFADAVGILRSGMVGLNESVRVAQVETRAGREDPVRSYVRSLKKLAKEMSPAVSMVRESEKKARPDVSAAAEEDEVVEALRDACSVTAAVSEAVFMSVSWCNSSNWMGLIRRKKSGEGMMMRELEEAAEMGQSEEKAVALRLLQTAEECVEGIERESERLYRSLICTRVSLLNVMTTR